MVVCNTFSPLQAMSGRPHVCSPWRLQFSSRGWQ